jgi:hypothetical protein
MSLMFCASVLGRIVTPLPDDAFFGFEWVRQQVNTQPPIEGPPTARLATRSALHGHVNRHGRTCLRRSACAGAASLPLRPLSALERMRSFSTALSAKVEDEILSATSSVKDSVKNAQGNFRQRLGSLRPEVPAAASPTTDGSAIAPAALRHGASAPNLTGPHAALDL